MEGDSDTLGQKDNFIENLTQDEARKIIESLQNYSPDWYSIMETMYPAYILVTLFQRADLQLDPKPQPLSDHEFFLFYVGGLPPGRRCLEVAYWVSKDSQKSEQIKSRQVELLSQKDNTIVEMNTRALQHEFAGKITAPKKPELN